MDSTRIFVVLFGGVLALLAIAAPVLIARSRKLPGLARNAVGLVTIGAIALATKLPYAAAAVWAAAVILACVLRKPTTPMTR